MNSPEFVDNTEFLDNTIIARAQRNKINAAKVKEYDNAVQNAQIGRVAQQLAAQQEAKRAAEQEIERMLAAASAHNYNDPKNYAPNRSFLATTWDNMQSGFNGLFDASPKELRQGQARRNQHEGEVIHNLVTRNPGWDEEALNRAIEQELQKKQGGK